MTMKKMNRNKINAIIAILIIIVVSLMGVGIVYAVNYGMISMYAHIVDIAIEYEHIIMIFNLNLVYGCVLYKIIKIISRKYNKYYDDNK